MPASVQLLMAAAVTAALYGFLLVTPYPLLSLYSTPLLDLGKLANHSAGDAARLLIGFAALFACCVWAAKAARQLEGRRWLIVVLGAAVAFGCILSLTYPLGALDIYDYAFRARMWGIYNYNPLLIAPWDVSQDAWYKYAVWVSSTSPYGPLWETISYSFNLLSGQSLLYNLLTYKALAVGCTLACGLLVYALRSESSAAERLSAVVLLTWNPLWLFEGAVNGHNDLLMVTGVLLALWLYRRGWPVAALAVCVLSALVKVAALVALPVLFATGLRSAKQRRRFALMGAAACIAVAALGYAPFWVGLNTFSGLLALDSRFTASLAAVFKLSAQGVVGEATAETWARLLALALFGSLYTYRLWKMDGRYEAVSAAAFAAFALLLAVGTLWFQPWYVTWIIALAPLAGRDAPRMALWWSAGALTTYLLFDFAWYWYPEFFNVGGELGINLAALTLWAGPVAWAAAVVPVRAGGDSSLCSK